MILAGNSHSVKFLFIQNPIRSNFHSVKFQFGQILIRSNPHSVKFSFDQIPIRSNSHSFKFSFGQFHKWVFDQMTCSHNGEVLSWPSVNQIIKGNTGLSRQKLWKNANRENFGKLFSFFFSFHLGIVNFFTNLFSSDVINLRWEIGGG